MADASPCDTALAQRMRPPSHPKPHANERARLLCSGHLRVGPVARLVDAATPPPLRPDALFCACPPLPTTAGIKKQACINRKCLLMVPRDEDGERLARKRAKQRTLPPGTSSSLRLAAGASSGEFGGGSLSLTLGGLGQLAMPRCMPIDDDNSELGSPISTSPPSAWGLSASTGVSGRASPTSEAEDDERAQSRNDRYLSTLALDDDDPAGRALTSAMLFAAIRTPESSPQRERAHAARSSQHSPLGKRGGASPASAHASHPPRRPPPKRPTPGAKRPGTPPPRRGVARTPLPPHWHSSRRSLASSMRPTRAPRAAPMASAPAPTAPRRPRLPRAPPPEGSLPCSRPRSQRR